MPSPGEYTPGEQRFINWLGVFALLLVGALMVGLVYKASKADFSGAVEYQAEQAKK